MFDSLKKFNTQLVIGVLLGVALLIIFSFYFFRNIRVISEINKETVAIYSLPRALSAIQITFSEERALISSLESGKMPIDRFNGEFQGIERREDSQFAALDDLLSGLKNASAIPRWSEENKIMEDNIRMMHQKRKDLEVALSDLASANGENDLIAQDMAGEKAFALYDFFDGTSDFLAREADVAAERQAVYFRSTTDAILRLLIIFVLLILTVIGTINAYVVIFSSRSLSIILDGIKKFDAGDPAYRIPLKSQNEFGVIAAALNTAMEHARESRGELENAQDQLVRKISELEKFKRLTVSREMKMIELKKEMEKIKNKNEFSL